MTSYLMIYYIILTKCNPWNQHHHFTENSSNSSEPSPMERKIERMESSSHEKMPVLTVKPEMKEMKKEKPMVGLEE